MTLEVPRSEQVGNATYLQVLRTIDKAGHLLPVDVFALLTSGRRDQSGAFIPGCNLPDEQAMVLVSLLFVMSHPIIAARIKLIRLLNSTEFENGTLWEYVMRCFSELPEPKNIVGFLDGIIYSLSEK